MSTFATRLKELRGDESQASFASSVDVNRVQYAKYESGQNAPSVDILERICRTHACSADWLLGLRDSQSSGSVIASGKNAVAVGHNSTVSIGESPACAKCPYKKKLKQFEALLKK